MKEKMLGALLFFVPLMVLGEMAPLQAQQPQDLRGVWQIVSYSRDGRPLPMEAWMILTEHHFTRVLRDKNRKKFDFNFRQVHNLTPQQYRAVAESFVQFNAAAGTYRVERGAVYFKSATHHNPGAENHEAKRNIGWKGERLLLSGPAGSGVLEEVWERVERF